MTLKNSSDISLSGSPLKKQDSGTSKVIYTSRLADTPGLQTELKVLEVEL